MPFGVYLRYYFCYNWRKTLRLSFLLSLFFELTQLSGLYFVYPGSYRLFDVDDLIVNTAGSMIGFALAGPVSHLLPTRQELDTVSFRRGCVHLLYAACFLISGRYGLPDLCIRYSGRSCGLVWESLSPFNGCQFYLLPTLGCCPFCSTVRRPGKRLTRMKIMQRNGDAAHWYQYFLRYGLLIAGLVGAPYYLNRLLFILMDVLHLDSLASLVLHGLLMGGYLFWLFFAGIRMALHKPLFYERWSRTKLVSTINRT